MDNKIIMLLATMMPKEEILKDLEESLIKYKEEQTDENEANLGTACILLLANLSTKGDLNKAMEVGEGMEKLKSFDQFMTGKN